MGNTSDQIYQAPSETNLCILIQIRMQQSPVYVREVDHITSMVM